MKPVSELYGRHRGEDVYVVGTGSSLRVFPTGFLEDRVTIGLNMAWKHLDVRYGITIHPDLNVPEFMAGERPRPDITWVVKGDKLAGMPADQLRHAEEHFYSFRTDAPERADADIDRTPGADETGRVVDWVRAPCDDYLYLWTSIAQPGVNLAANLGARSVILVGCDNAALLGNHHAHEQHTRWLGAAPDDRYRLYYEGLAEMREPLRERGVELVSLTPFLTLGPHDEEFLRLCEELGVAPHVDGTGDISDSYVAPWQAEQQRRRGGPVTRAARRLRRAAGAARRRITGR